MEIDLFSHHDYDLLRYQRDYTQIFKIHGSGSKFSSGEYPQSLQLHESIYKEIIENYRDNEDIGPKTTGLMPSLADKGTTCV